MKQPTVPFKPSRRSVVTAVLLALAFALLATGVIQAASGGVNLFGAMPPDKAKVMDKNVAAAATAHALHPVKPTMRPNEGQPTGPTPTTSSGIFTVYSGPVSNSTFSTGSLYRGWVGSRFEFVYAGSGWTNYAAGESRGEVRVFDGNGAPVGVYDDNDGSASLRIVSVSGEELTLQTSKGTTVTFNLVTDTFGS